MFASPLSGGLLLNTQLPAFQALVVVYRLAIQRVFLVAVTVLCLFGKDIVLRVDLITGYGLEEKEKKR